MLDKTAQAPMFISSLDTNVLGIAIAQTRRSRASFNLPQVKVPHPKNSSAFSVTIFQTFWTQSGDAFSLYINHVTKDIIIEIIIKDVVVGMGGVVKELKDMSLEELWELFPIELVAHRSAWREWADGEIADLSEALALYTPIITHVGSTAVPDIWAKPIIDILIELPEDTDWSQIKYILERSEYICMSQSETRLSFNKGYTPNGFAEKVFHVHVRKVGDNDEICFRDYLIANPEVAKEYEALKLSLLPKYRNNRDGYTEAKTEFVKRVIELAKIK